MFTCTQDRVRYTLAEPLVEFVALEFKSALLWEGVEREARLPNGDLELYGLALAEGALGDAHLEDVAEACLDVAGIVRGRFKARCERHSDLCVVKLKAQLRAAERVVGALDEIDAQKQPGSVEAVLEFLNQEALAVHGTLALVDRIGAGAHPFEVAEDFTVDLWLDGATRGVMIRFDVDAEDGPGELFGRIQFESPVDVGEVLAIEAIEVRTVGR